MKVKIQIRFKKEILEPEGKAVLHALHDLGFISVMDTRICRLIILDIKGKDKKSVEKQVEQMCDKLLVNSVIEEYGIEIE